MDSAFIHQTERNVELLISQGRFRDAHNLCNEILSRYPELTEFEKFRKQIEEEATKSNDELVAKKIEDLEPLWDQEKYQEILNSLKYLMKYSPNNKDLLKHYSKAQKLYMNQVSNLKKQFIKEATVKLENLFKEDPDKIINECYVLERSNQGNPDILNLAKTYRSKLIHKKIEDKDDLIYSEKFDLIEDFLTNLKKIDEKNEEIKKLEKLVKQRQWDAQLEEKKEYIYKGENYLNTLLRLGKYAEAIKVAEEILKIDKNDHEALRSLSKAKAGYYCQTKDQTVDLIQNDQAKLKQDYMADKEKFIKI